MFTCTACLRRAFDSVILEHWPVPSVKTTSRRLLRPGLSRTHAAPSARVAISFSRQHATYESLRTGHHLRVLRHALKTRQSTGKLPPPNRRRKAPYAYTKGEIKDAIARANNRENQLIKNDAEDRSAQGRLKKEVALHHKDPLALAHVVQKWLKVPDFTAALNIVRASEGIVANNVVSWNHLVDYQMSQGDPEKAWKVYNEMKKRGHRPDAHTYTIMLRGLSQNSHKANASERAVSIYNSMFAPNSSVSPNTIHTNAALNVCARKRDMDSMWAIAGRMPESGPGAADPATFTTILYAIKEDAIAKVADLLRDSMGQNEAETSQRQQEIFEDALKDGRKLWSDIVHRWSRANLILDEMLVCAAGRLVLGCGSRKDFEQIFDLVDQTMNTRPRARGDWPQLTLPSPESQGGPVSNFDNGALEGNGEETEETTQAIESNIQPIATSEAFNMDEGHVDQSYERRGLPLAKQTVYALPGNNTLSMLMEAAVGLKNMKVGKAYWNLLTDPDGPYKVQPDAQNIIAYLRLLRISRSSRDALEVLSREYPPDVASKLYRRGTFVIAMSTCVRDKNSPFVFETADKLLSLMQDKLEEAALGMYDSNVRISELKTRKERLQAVRERVTQMDYTFGEDEAQAEFHRSRDGVESLTADPKALRMYLELAVLKTPGWNEGRHDKSVDVRSEIFPRRPSQNNVLRALNRLWNDLLLIRRLAQKKIQEIEMGRLPGPSSRQRYNRFNKATKQGSANTNVAENVEDLVDLLRTVTGVYDKVIMMQERFEDEGLALLDEKIVSQFRSQKRMISAFLTQTKGEMQKLKSRQLEFSKWRNRTEQDYSEEENNAEDDDENQEGPMEVATASELTRRYKAENVGVGVNTSGGDSGRTPQIAREVRQIYADTDRELGRIKSLSRRQRNERRAGVAKRMRLRLDFDPSATARVPQGEAHV